MAEDKPKAGTVAESVSDDVATAESHRAAVQAEYAVYVAKGPIDHDGVRAYNTGDPVPVSNVKRWNYEERGLVGKRDSAAGKAALAESLAEPGRA